MNYISTLVYIYYMYYEESDSKNTGVFSFFDKPEKVECQGRSVGGGTPVPPLDMTCAPLGPPLEPEAGSN